MAFWGTHTSKHSIGFFSSSLLATFLGNIFSGNVTLRKTHFCIEDIGPRLCFLPRPSGQPSSGVFWVPCQILGGQFSSIPHAMLSQFHGGNGSWGLKSHISLLSTSYILWVCVTCVLNPWVVLLPLRKHRGSQEHGHSHCWKPGAWACPPLEVRGMGMPIAESQEHGHSHRWKPGTWACPPLKARGMGMPTAGSQGHGHAHCWKPGAWAFPLLEARNMGIPTAGTDGAK